MRLPLRYRLLLPLAFLLAGDALVTAWAATTAAHAAERRLAEQLWAVARALTGPPQFPLSGPILTQMKRLSGAEFLFERSDHSRISTFPEPTTPPPPLPFTPPTEDGETHRLGPPVTVAGQDYRGLRLPLRPPHPNAGGSLYIFYPESLRRSAVQDAIGPPLMLGVVGGLAAVGLALALGTRLVGRIRELEHRTRLIAAGDFRPMTLPAADDELTDLCRSVNDMARRLADFQDAMRNGERLRVLGQFSGGLAHQLRNAAAGAKLAVELFLSENPQADPEPLRVALRQLARIEANIRQFLDLGKPPDPVKKPCDLGQLIDQTVNLLRPQCRHAGITLIWEPPAEAVTIPGDPMQLGHLFGNVIGNAIEAAGPEGSVSVALAAAQSGALLEITDTGPGPPADIAPKLFEPFVTGKEEGIGLGLAVAKQAVDAHAGRLSWTRENSRTVFRIELPGYSPGEAAITPPA